MATPGPNSLPPTRGASSRPSFSAWLSTFLGTFFSAVWWRARPSPAAWLLWPWSMLYRAALTLHRARARPAAATQVPVCVVGNWVVGGAGKTPVVMALVQALAAAGHRPGVISRGHGRSGGSTAALPPVLEVSAASSAEEVGDEPALIHRRTRVPVFVGRERARAAAALCAAHPTVDVIVSDDGLQHLALARVAEVVVFDDRGLGNGLLLPAGPLRQPVPSQLPPGTVVLYTGRGISAPWPGLHVPRTATGALPLAAWAAGSREGLQPLAALRGRQLTAVAGIGAPAQFFAMLEGAGLQITPCPQEDHARYTTAPWPAGTAEVITTEKDAIKLAALGAHSGLDVPVWVVPLDCTLPEPWLREFIASLFGKRPAQNPSGAKGNHDD